MIGVTLIHTPQSKAPTDALEYMTMLFLFFYLSLECTSWAIITVHSIDCSSHTPAHSHFNLTTFPCCLLSLYFALFPCGKRSILLYTRFIVLKAWFNHSLNFVWCFPNASLLSAKFFHHQLFFLSKFLFYLLSTQRYDTIIKQLSPLHLFIIFLFSSQLPPLP